MLKNTPLPAQLLSRKPESHKGTYGHLLIIGSSLGMSGAVVLAAKAALRSGLGKVSVGVPSSFNYIIETALPEALTLSLKESPEHFLVEEAYDAIETYFNKIDAVVIGPGLGTNLQTQRLLYRLLGLIRIPAVIDADALNILSLHTDWMQNLKGKPFVLTPHPGEFSRLMHRSIEEIMKERKDVVKEFVNVYNMCIVLKGYKTLVAHKGEFFENNTGNPGMATAGSGDVLAGIIGSFLAQGLELFEAARWGVYLHGLAGDIAAGVKGEISLIASDIIDFLPQAFLNLRKDLS